MAVDILYVSFNRLSYVRESFDALARNTDWSEVSTLFVADDGSTDGTREWLEQAVRQIEATVVMHPERFGGPVSATNWLLDQESETESFAKIDCDMVVPPGWLGDMLKCMTMYPTVDILGMEPFQDRVAPCPTVREPRFVEHIGGKGVIRKRAFGHCRMVANGYFGFTEWQTKHPDVVKAWAYPDIPCFGLDQLPFEPWTTLTQRYVDLGWHRYWPPYSPDATGYWSWWSPSHGDPLETLR